MNERRGETAPAEPPGKGEGIEEASKEAVRELEKRGHDGHAGTGDIG